MSSKKPTSTGDLLAGFAAGGARAQAAVDALTSSSSSSETKCAVDLHCVELVHSSTPLAATVPRDDWFEVIYGATGQIIRFCPRHALAAEALVSYAGWRGVDVPRALRSLEGGGPPTYEREHAATHKGARVAGDECKACGGTRAEHNRSKRCAGFE